MNINQSITQQFWNSLKVLQEKQDDQYQPDQQQILQYAQYLGLQFPNDIKYLPILKQGLTAHLPEQWQACHTPDGDLLYRNIITKVIQQQHPLDQYYRQYISQLKQQDQSPQKQLSVIQQQPKNQSQFYQNSQKLTQKIQFSSKQKQSDNYFDKNITQYSQLDSQINNNRQRRSSTHRDTSSGASNFINKHVYGLAKQQKLSNPAQDLPQFPKYTHSADITNKNQSPEKTTDINFVKYQQILKKQKMLKRQNKILLIQNIKKQIKLRKQVLKKLQKQNKQSFKLIRKKLHNKQKRIKKNQQYLNKNNQNNIKQYQNQNQKSISLKQIDQKMFDIPTNIKIDLTNQNKQKIAMAKKNKRYQ